MIRLELTVNNHPGVMSQITGLFSRRAFNLEGILCTGLRDDSLSRIILFVTKDERLQQIIKELERLYDVNEVTFKDEPANSLYKDLQEICEGKTVGV